MATVEWWTSEQIYRWEILRRGVEAKFDSEGVVTLSTANPLRDATLLVLKPRPEPRTIRLGGEAVPGCPSSLYGFEFEAVTIDLAGRVQVGIDAM